MARRVKVRTRPGRIRRWLVRPFFWALAAAAVALLLIALLLRSDRVEERARLLLVRQAESFLDREVEIGTLSFVLLPFSVELGGVVIGGGPERPPFATVERLVVEGWARGLFRPTFTLSRVLADGLHLTMRFEEEGGDNLPRRPEGRRARRGPLPFELEIGQLEVVDSALEVDHRRLPLALEARALKASLLGGRGLELRGRVDAQDVSIELPRARPYLGAVSLRVEVGPGEVRIERGRLSGPDLRADVTGSWGWRDERVLSLDIDARSRAALFDALGYTSGQVAGGFEFRGGFAWRPQVWGFRGALTSDALTVFERRVAELSAVVSGDRNGIQVDVERGRYGGGSLHGDVSWALRAEGRPVEIDLDLEGVALRRLLEDQRIPLRGVDGRVSGLFSYRFAMSEARAGDGWADLAVAPPPAGAAAIGLRGTAPLTIDRGVIRSDAIRLASDAQRVLASGAYDLGRRGGRFDLEVESARVEELLRALPISEELLEGALWAPAAGGGTVGAELEIGGEGVATRVRLDLLDVRAPGFSAARLQGGLRVTGDGIEELRLELLESEAGLIVTGRVPFAGPFSLAVDLAGWPLDDVRPWLPFELPLDGRLSGTVLLAGEPGGPAGTVTAIVRPAVLAGAPADELDLELEFEAGGAVFGTARVRAPAGELELSGSVDAVGRTLDLALASGDLDLERAPLAALTPGGLRGRLRAAGSLRGDLDRPRLGATLLWSGLEVGGRELPEAELRLSWDGERLAAEGALPGLDRVGGGGRLDAAGVDASFAIAGSDLWAVSRLLTTRTPEGAAGEFAGRVAVAGPLGSGALPAVELRLDRLTARYQDLELRNKEPVALSWEGAELRVASLYLGHDETASELFVGGRVDLGEPGALDLNLQSSLASDWFQPFLPGLRLAGGRFEAIGSIQGTLDDPRLDGVGEIGDARLLLDSPPLSFDRLRGVVLFYPDRIVVDRARAEVAGGTIEATGEVPVSGGPGGLGYQLRFQGRDLTVRYPEGWLLEGDVRGSLASTPEGRTLRGEVDLRRALYLRRVEVGLASLLQTIFARRRVEVETTDEALAATGLNLEIRGANALRVRNNLANLGGSLDLALVGSLARPVLFGRVDLEPGGTLVYAGNEYEIERGALTFANPYTIQPVIDLVATTDLREYDVTLTLSGSLERLNTTFSSDPPLADLQVLALLTGGEETGRGAGTRESLATGSVGAEGFLYGQAASLVTDRVTRLFGVDRLRIDPLTSSSGDLSSARVTVGERLSRDLFATYSYDPSTTQGQILELEWNISPSLVLVLTQNGDESYAVDLRWEKVF